MTRFDLDGFNLRDTFKEPIYRVNRGLDVFYLISLDCFINKKIVNTLLSYAIA